MAPDPESTREATPQPAENRPTDPRVGDRYVPGVKIDEGGMGAVYHAIDTLLDRKVAIKVLKPEHANGSLARRFAGEARITAQLQHPSIPPVHDIGTFPDGRPFLAMKFIKGKNLRNHLKGRKDLSEDRTRYVLAFEQICQAVAYAHDRGVIHRDLKPQNVMLGEFGEVQVMDWGLAKVLPPDEPDGPDDSTEVEEMVEYSRVKTRCEEGLESTEVGGWIGSPGYMAPEQARGAVGRIDRRTDVFGLGGILAVVLTGKPPFAAKSANAAVMMAARGEIEECFARLDGCGADPELVALCKRCLTADRAKRPADAGVVAADMAAYLGSVAARLRGAELARAAAEARAEQEQARAAAERRARRLGLGLAGAVLAAVVVGGGGWAVAWHRQGTAELAEEKARVAAAEAKLAGEEKRAAAAEAKLAGEEKRAAEARAALVTVQRAAAEELSIDDVRAAEALTLVVQEWQRTPNAQHVVRKIQLLQALGRLAFADTPRAREAALQSWRRLEAYLRTQVWFPGFLDGHRAELDTVARADASPKERRVALLEVSTALRRAADEFGEGQYLAPLKRFQGEWYAQADRAAGRLADAARDGRPLDEVRSYARLFWRLYCAETVLVEDRDVARAMVAVGEQLDRWDQAGPGAAPAGLDADLRAAVEAYRTAYQAELARAKK